MEPLAKTYGPELEGFEYPFPVHKFDFQSQQQKLHMAFLDVAPTGSANGKVALLLHGKNFCSATWEATIRVLTGAGYRVIAPDQIGFCKSSKPHSYQFTFQQLAYNTRALLDSIGIEHSVVIGHSTGGMIATHYALLFPDRTDRLVLVDPIGLEDVAAKGVPYPTIDQWYANELKTTGESIKAYENQTYYVNNWKPEYDKWVEMLGGMNEGPGKEAVAWNAALTDDMLFTQPIVSILPQLKPNTLLITGDKDNTAIGKNFAPPALQPALGNYPVLAEQAKAAIPHVTLVRFPNAGHVPQMSDPDEFHKVLMDWLGRP